MASRPGSRRISSGGSSQNISENTTEPFPAMPDSPPGPSSNTFTTTTTTTTTIPARGRPYTITSSHPANQTRSTVVTSPNNASPPATIRTVTAASPQFNRVRPIGIRRLPSSNLRQAYEAAASPGDASGNVSRSSTVRGRSTSAPQSAGLTVPGSIGLTRQSTRQSQLPSVAEHGPAHTGGEADRNTMNEAGAGGIRRRRSISNTARSIMSRFSDPSRERQEPEYDSDVVDLLDVLGRFSNWAGNALDSNLSQIPKSRL